MKISYKELQVNDYTIRGLFTEPNNGYTDIAVMLHGYTGHKNENGFLFKQITKTLVECGIATLRFDYYGSGDSDGEFHEQNFTTVRNDAKAAIDKAVKLNNGFIDRLCNGLSLSEEYKQIIRDARQELSETRNIQVIKPCK